MLTLTVGVLAFAAGMNFILAIQRWEDRRQNPFRWACSQCDARVKGSEMEMVDAFISAHKEVHP